MPGSPAAASAGGAEFPVPAMARKTAGPAPASILRDRTAGIAIPRCLSESGPARCRRAHRCRNAGWTATGRSDRSPRPRARPQAWLRCGLCASGIRRTASRPARTSASRSSCGCCRRPTCRWPGRHLPTEAGRSTGPSGGHPCCQLPAASGALSGWTTRAAFRRPPARHHGDWRPVETESSCAARRSTDAAPKQRTCRSSSPPRPRPNSGRSASPCPPRWVPRR